VLNIVPGGLEAGEALVAHPDVDKIAFTGSTPAGRKISGVCGRLLRPVTLELGGKSAAIVLDDADLDATLAGLARVSFANNGQTCYLSTRRPGPTRQRTRPRTRPRGPERIPRMEVGTPPFLMCGPGRCPRWSPAGPTAAGSGPH